MPWLPVLHTPEQDLKFFGRIVREQQVDVAEMNGHVIGFCSVDGDWVEQLYIHPDHHRKGIGSTFMNRAKAGAANLQLWVFQQNLEAQTFYAHHGFTLVERTDGSNNEERCPDLRMTWQRDT